jgi:hypothetical protein
MALARLEKQAAENSAILKQLRAGQSASSHDDVADLDTLLSEPMVTKEQLENMSTKLQEANFKKQMVYIIYHTFEIGYKF